MYCMSDSQILDFPFLFLPLFVGSFKDVSYLISDYCIRLPILLTDLVMQQR